MLGCSVQYAENSDSDMVPSMNGGAVREERSPLNEAMDFTNAFISVLGRRSCERVEEKKYQRVKG